MSVSLLSAFFWLESKQCLCLSYLESNQIWNENHLMTVHVKGGVVTQNVYYLSSQYNWKNSNHVFCVQTLSWYVVFQIVCEIILSKYKEEFQVDLPAPCFVTELLFWVSCHSCYYVLWGRGRWEYSCLAMICQFLFVFYSYVHFPNCQYNKSYFIFCEFHMIFLF